MFDLDTFTAECVEAVRDADPRRAVREVLLRTVADPSPVATALGKETSGMDVLYNARDLTILNVIWAPEMTILPHDHRMWALIGIYGGVEDNTLYQRTPDRITPAGGRSLHESEVLALGADAIHSVANPERRYTGAIHIYGGDFVNEPRSQWDPDTLMEEPYDLAYVQRLFAEANQAWVAQVGQDLDDSAE